VASVPRAYRLQVPQGLYHVTANGGLRRALFENNSERAEFLNLVAKVVALRHWSCRSYCLLTTHYHLLVNTPDGDLSAGLQHLNGRYAQWTNWCRGERGHLFRERFNSVLVESGSHALESYRYIAMNPVRAGVVARPEDWRWSSYAALLGLAPAAECLDVAGALLDFHLDVDAARPRLASFVNDAL
jgi:putative transposase